MRDEESCDAMQQRPPTILQGAFEMGWLLHIVLNRDEGFRPLYNTNLSLDVGYSWVGDANTGEAALFSEGNS